MKAKRDFLTEVKNSLERKGYKVGIHDKPNIEEHLSINIDYPSEDNSKHIIVVEPYFMKVSRDEEYHKSTVLYLAVWDRKKDLKDDFVNSMRKELNDPKLPAPLEKEWKRMLIVEQYNLSEEIVEASKVAERIEEVLKAIGRVVK